MGPYKPPIDCAIYSETTIRPTLQSNTSLLNFAAFDAGTAAMAGTASSGASQLDELICK